MKNKLILLALLALAAFMVITITGCSSSKDKNTTKYLVIYDDDGPKMGDYYGGLYSSNGSYISDTSGQIFYCVEGIAFAWLSNKQIHAPGNVWSGVELRIVKDKVFFFGLEIYDSETDTWSDDWATSGFDITVSPSDLATVNKSNGSITSKKVGTGTITFKYQGVSRKITFKVVNDASGLPALPVL